MKLTQIAVVAAALFGGVHAANNDGVFDSAEERGIDCNGDGSDSYATCSCWTDLKTTWAAPTLINDDTDRANALLADGVTADTNADVRETGLYTNGANTDLEVAFTLHPRTFVQAATHVSGSTPAVLDGNGNLALNQDGFATAIRYANPTARFVTETNAETNCLFTTAGSTARTTTVDDSADGAFIISRPTFAYDGGASCDLEVNKFSAHFRTDFKAAIGHCGFTDDRTDVNGTPLSNQGAVVDSSTYTRYLGRIKVQTTRQNGELRGQENVLQEEYAFQISVLFPEQVTVTSSAVSIIGSATYDAQLTHQIYDSANNNLNLNMFVGTTYPFALSTSTLAGPNKDVGATAGDTISASLALNTTYSLTAYLDQFDTTSSTNFGGEAKVINRADDLALFQQYCEETDGGNDPEDGQGAAYNSGYFCDFNGNGLPDLTDFVVVSNAGTLNYEQGTLELGTGFFGADGLPTPLEVARCTGENGQTENAGACLQNAFMRLEPRSWYCDFNLALELTLTTTCRDDTTGTGAGGSDSIQSDFFSTTKQSVDPYPALSDHTLFNTDGSPLVCSSAQYREATKADQTFSFQLASDNFCPRTIATGVLNVPEMSIYESTFGVSTWGAHGCTSQANCELELTNMGTSSTCTAGAHSTNNQCLQVPGYAADSTTATTGLRKAQSEFVFGTTAFLETRIAVTSGVNIKDTKIDELYIGRTETTESTPVARSGYPSGTTVDITAVNGLWHKQLIVGNNVVSSGQTYTSAATGNPTVTSVVPFVKLSDKLIDNSLIFIGATEQDFFATADSSPINPAVGTASEAAKLGANFEGVSRVTVEMNEYTVFISDAAQEAAEPIAFYANIDITYLPANEQGNLGAAKETVQGSQKIGSDAANRARSLAAPTVTGGQASAQAGIRPAGTTGAAGSSSTIAGFSSTTVLAAAAVLGAIVVAAGASFFVVRKRRTAAAKTAKRSSSSTELNDTAQVQV